MMIYFTLILVLSSSQVDFVDPVIGPDSPVMHYKNESISAPLYLLPKNSLTGSFGCELNIYLDSGTINPGFYQAMNQIIATQIIPTGSVTLRAANEVLLEAGFEVQTGSTLEIELGDCVF